MVGELNVRREVFIFISCPFLLDTNCLTWVQSRFHHRLLHPNYRLCYEWFPDYYWEFYGESTKFKDYCFLCVSINKAPDLNFVTFFFIFAAQTLMHFSMTNGDSFVKGQGLHYFSKW